MLSLKTQSYPLPEAIDSAVKAGAFGLAELLMDKYLADRDCPKEIKDRIELEKHNLEFIKSGYPYTIDEADAILLEAYPETYKKGDIHAYVLNGNLDWRFVNGTIKIEKRLVGDAAKRCKGLLPELSDDNQDSDSTLRDVNVAYMLEHKSRRAKVRIKATVKPLNGFGELAFVNIPVVRKADSIESIRFISASAGYLGVDDENALMRTARFSKVLEEGDVFFIEFEYIIKAIYNDLSNCSEPIDASAFKEYLKEEGPHILFTPFLKSLAASITKGLERPSEKAKAIYMWITTNVKYSFAREYGSINNIPEYAASNLKGDCGIQALLFITLCRIAGVPSRWQSGWYTTPEGVFCHDWAEFYIPEKGWCFADCSFGGAGYKLGKRERWQYYFGSGDVFRTPNNNACQLKLNGKKHYASDPIDNQRCEIETESGPLERSDIKWEGKVISFDFLED